MEDKSPILSFKIPGSAARMPIELNIFEDYIECITFWTFKSKRLKSLYADIKRLTIQNNETGWPRYLVIFKKDGKNETFDLGFSKSGEEIKSYIESKIN